MGNPTVGTRVLHVSAKLIRTKLQRTEFTSENKIDTIQCDTINVPKILEIKKLAFKNLFQELRVDYNLVMTKEMPKLCSPQSDGKVPLSRSVIVQFHFFFKEEVSLPPILAALVILLLRSYFQPVLEKLRSSKRHSRQLGTK